MTTGDALADVAEPLAFVFVTNTSARSTVAVWLENAVPYASVAVASAVPLTEDLSVKKARFVVQPTVPIWPVDNVVAPPEVYSQPPIVWLVELTVHALLSTEAVPPPAPALMSTSRLPEESNWRGSVCPVDGVGAAELKIPPVMSV